MSSQDDLYGLLLMEYVINRSPLAGVPSPRLGRVIPMHRTPSGALGPFGLIAGVHYDPSMEMLELRNSIQRVRESVGEDELNLVDTVGQGAIQAEVDFHDGLLQQRDVMRKVNEGEEVTRPSQWLKRILTMSRSDGNLAQSAAVRKTARFALRDRGNNGRA